MHSDQPLTLEVGDTVSTNLEQAAQQMVIREKGNMQENKAEVALQYFPKK
jgi:hypothetical protein